jgi:hypothetical protein
MAAAQSLVFEPICATLANHQVALRSTPEIFSARM